MTPQVNLDGKDQVAQAPPSSAPAPAPPVERVERPEPHELTYAARQGLAMSWVGIALGIFLLFGGLALWAAVVLNAGFGGWLLGVAVLGAVMVATIFIISFYIIRPGRSGR